jgi:acetate kinase
VGQSKRGVLSINSGSSSIRFALYQIGEPMERILAGKIDRIGLSGTNLTFSEASHGQQVSLEVEIPAHSSAASFLIEWLEQEMGLAHVSAVGHRVVHGMKHTEPERVSPALLDELRGISAYDPEHLPGEIELTEAFRQRYPQVAQGRVILAHPGNGASLAAVRDGRSIDTSMGFTPAGGLAMGARSGDLDPGVAWYMIQREHLTSKQFNHLVNHESGLLGMSETSSDMRDLLAQAPGDERAAEAIDVFCYQVKKWIGAFAAAMGGLDTLVFAGGIGEHAPVVRAQMCSGLEFLGIEIDEPSNAQNAGVISTETGRVAVRIMHTDEELMIAKLVCGLLGLSNE